MSDALISIIVPAYNIEAYIGRCIESILNQEHKNLEIILVNDGSTDRTAEIIEEYTAKDERIISIHKTNGGVSSARFAGVKRATGDYIGFVDGDDFIEPQMYSTLLRNAEKYHADISHCGYQMVFPDHIDFYYNTGNVVLQDKQTGLKDLLMGTFIEPGIWNKLYRKELFDDALENNIPIDIKINEDVLMNYWLFKASDRSVYDDFCPYHYILRKGSAATSKLNEHKLKDPVRVMKIIIKDSKKMTEVCRIAEERLINQFVGISTMSTTDQKELVKSFRKEIRRELRKNVWSILKKSYFKKLTKLKVMWVAIFPSSYRWIHDIYAKAKGIDKKYHVE